MGGVLMLIEDWFSAQIFITDMSNLLPIAKQVSVGIENRVITQPNAITYGGVTTYPRDSIFDSDEYVPLRDRIIELVTAIAIQQGIDMTKHHVWLSDLWVNMMNENSEHGVHSHAPSAYSGCFYVECPIGSSPTRFFNPIYSLALTCPLPADTKATHEWVDIAPQEGKVVVWNGWLAHNVPPNRSKTPRVTISFNALIKENK